MMAVLYVLVTDNLVNPPFVLAHSVGFDQLENYVLGKEGAVTLTPHWAESICGVPVSENIRFARAYAAE